jgi:hypothetical protein
MLGDLLLACSTTNRYKRRAVAVRKFKFFNNFDAREPSPLIRTNGLSVVYAGGITQHAGVVVSPGFIGISEIARSLPYGAPS